MDLERALDTQPPQKLLYKLHDKLGGCYSILQQPRRVRLEPEGSGVQRYVGGLLGYGWAVCSGMGGRVVSHTYSVHAHGSDWFCELEGEQAQMQSRPDPGINSWVGAR